MGNDSPDSPDNDVPSNSKQKGFGHFLAELRRRKVYRVAATYLVVGWIIIQVANATFADFGIPVWAYRFVVLILLLGFPVAIILTWAFELTPDGVRTTRAAQRDTFNREESHSHRRKRNWMAYGLGAALPTLIFGVLAIVFYIQNRSLVTQIEVNKQVEEIDKSIAVLPFDNRSKLEDDEYFTEGIHDDLLTQISRIRGVKTISRTSVMAYKDTTKNMRQIGEELGVSTLLEGGVQRAGNRIRINLQLIDANTDAHIWAETYTRELTAENIFEIQSEIAQSIARELKAVLSPEDHKRLANAPTDNLEALEYYFRALGTDYSTDGLAKSVEYLKKAILLDPGFALAHAQLAHVYHSQIWYSGLPSDQQNALSEKHMNLALSLDPDLSAAWLVKGLIARDAGKFKAAEQAYDKALELNPNSDATYLNYSIMLLWDLEQFDRALQTVNKSIELNPEDPNGYIHKAMVLGRMKRFDEARDIWNSLNKHYPDDANVQVQVASNLFGSSGRDDLAIQALRKAHFLDPENPNAILRLIFGYFRIGDKEKAMFWMKRGLEISPDGEYASYFRIAIELTNQHTEEANELWLTGYAENKLSTNEEVNATSILSLQEFDQGIWEPTLTRFRLVVPEYFEPGFKLPDVAWSGDYKSLNTVVYISEAKRISGDIEGADALLDQVFKKLGKETDSWTYWEAKLFAGKPETTLAAMKPFLESDTFHVSGLEDYPWDRMKQFPLFNNWVERNAAWQKKMRDSLERMEANGDLAPIPPLPGED